MDIKKTAQVLISIVLIGVIISWIDVRELSSILADANILYIALALVIATVSRLLMAFKWNLLLRAKDIHLSWYEVAKIYYTASFLGVILPSTIGSDVIKAYRVSRSRFPLADIVTSIVVERILGLMALLLFGSVGVVIYVTRYSDSDPRTVQIVYVVVGVTLLSVSLFCVSLSTSFSRGVYRLLGKCEGGGVVAWVSRELAKLYRSYQLYSRSKGTLALFFVLTCVENVLPIIRPFVVAVALNGHVPLGYLFVIVPIALLVIRLPIAFDGFGFHEGIYVYFLGLIGMSRDMAFGIGLVNHLIFLVALLPGCAFYLAGEREVVKTAMVEGESPGIKKVRKGCG
jgi:hypothetical protein